MTKEIKCQQLMNAERKPMFCLTIGNKPLAMINPEVADKMEVKDEFILLYKNKEIVIKFWKYI